MPRIAHSPRHAVKKREIDSITAENYFPRARGTYGAHETSWDSVGRFTDDSEYARDKTPSAIAAKYGISLDNLAKYMYAKHGYDVGNLKDIDELNLRDFNDFLREYDVGEPGKTAERLERITVDSLPGSFPIHNAIRERARTLGISADDFARAYVQKFNIDDKHPPTISDIRKLGLQDVIDTLTPHRFEIRPSSPESSDELDTEMRHTVERPRSPSRMRERPISEGVAMGGAGRDAQPMAPTATSRSLSNLHRRPTSDVRRLRSILHNREQELIDAEQQADQIRTLISQQEGYPDPELEAQLQEANERKVFAKEAARIAASNLSDQQGIQRSQQIDEEVAAARTRQAAADEAARASRPAIPPGVAATMHNQPEFLGGPTGFAGKNIAAVQRELEEPYRPYIGEKVAPFDILQRLSHEQARGVHAREKGMTSLYGRLAKKMEETLGERSWDRMLPYLEQGVASPAELAKLAEQFREPYNKQMAMIEEDTKRNLIENIIPAIRSKFSMRSGHRALHEERALRDVGEFLARQREAFAEKSLGESLKHARDYVERNLRGAELADRSQTTDASRIADTARVLHELATKEQERSLLGANTLGRIGAEAQAQRQAEINAAIAAHKEQQEYPLRRRALATAIANATPVSNETLHLYRDPPTYTPSPLTQLGGLATALGAMHYANLGRSDMHKGGRIRSKHRRGGRIKFAEGGAVHQFLQNHRDSSNPFERGAENAMEMIRRHRQKLNDYATDMERPGPNPIWNWLAKTGLGIASSQNPNTLGAIGEAGYNAFDAYENALVQEEVKKARAANIHKALMKTYQIEEENKLKNEMKRKNIAFDQMYKNNQLEELIRHHREIERVKGRNSNTYAGLHSTPENPISGSGIEDNAGTPPSSLMLSPLTSERKKRMEEIRNELKANEEVKNISKRMLDLEPKTGWQGAFGDKLNPTVATLLAGDAGAHGEFEKLSNDLQLARQDSLKSRGSDLQRKMIAESKPRHGTHPDTNKAILNETYAGSLQREIKRNFERKGIESGIPDSVIEDAISKWKKDNPKVIKGKPVMPKNSPEDYLPKEYKAQIQLGRPDIMEDTNHIKSLPVDQKKALLDQVNAALAAKGA